MHPFISNALMLAGISAALATPVSMAQAQDGTASHTSGLRPLTWSGRTTPTTLPAATYASAGTARANVLPRGGYQINPPISGHSPVSSQPQRQGLTPASAFYGGPAPRPVPFTAPSSAVPAAPAAAPIAETAPPASAPVEYFAATATPEADPEVTQAPQPDAVHDPMAPRRDAPIFRIGPQSAPQPSPTQVQAAAQPQPHTAAPAFVASRYYSVHRQNGRQPDRTPSPAPLYLDALPVDVTGMAGSADLAEPPAPPTLIRNTNGRVQAMPNLDDVGP